MADKKKKMDFSEQLAKKLEELGTVDCGVLGANEGKWVTVQLDKESIEFFFDMDGQTIQSLFATRDVYEKVDQEVLIKMYNKNEE